MKKMKTVKALASISLRNKQIANAIHLACTSFVVRLEPGTLTVATRTRILSVTKPEKVYNETIIRNGGKFQIFKCAEFGLERTTRNLTNKKSSVPKSKNAPAGSFPKCR